MSSKVKPDESRFKDVMTPAELNKWMKYIKTRSMSFQTVSGMEQETKEFLELWNSVENYQGAKRSYDNITWSHEYWTMLVHLDFQFITLQQMYTKIKRETQT